MKEERRQRRLAMIVAGGTGGHLYPGIALARALRKTAVPWDVLFIVRRGDMGREALEREGFAVEEIAGQGFPRSFGWRMFTFPFRFVAGCWEAWWVVRSRRPSAVIGMGGYLSFPVLVSSRLQQVPTFIHEQNVLPGLANRLLGAWVQAVAISFDESRSHFKSNQIWLSGLPVRHEIGQVTKEEGRQSLGLEAGKTTILIFGGSQGAHRLNEVLLETWRRLASEADHFQVLHITGPRHQAAMESAYRSLPIKSVVMGYCHDMPSAYAAADLVICRAGASTMAELLSAARPSILIPFPYASDNHQLFNAKVLENRGLSEIVEERSLSPDMLAERLRALVSRPDLLKSWQDRFETPASRDASKGLAADRLAQLITEAVQRS